MVAKKQKAGKQPPRNAKKKGCLTGLFGWIIAIIVIGVIAVWGFKKCSGGNDEDRQDPKTFERIMSQASADSLATAIGFPEATKEVAPRAGEYEVVADNTPIKIILQPDQKGKVVGRANFLIGRTAREWGFYSYCGNNIYAIYEDEEDIGGEPRNYFFAMPDSDAIMIIDDGKYVLKRKDLPKPIEGRGKGTLLSRDYLKCMDEAMATASIKKEGFPDTFEDHAPEFGTYALKVEKGGETHTVEVKLEPYEGKNQMIVAKITMLGDGKEGLWAYVGYCGFSVYALYSWEKADKPRDEYDVELNKTTHDFFYANEDGKSISMYDRGKEVMKLSKDNVETVKVDK